MSESFTVMNGVKQGGVLSSVLFAVYHDGLLLRLLEGGIGCHMGGHYAGALAYADDITLKSPSMTGLRKMSSICEQYASEYDILFILLRLEEYLWTTDNQFVSSQVIQQTSVFMHYLNLLNILKAVPLLCMLHFLTLVRLLI